VSPLGAISIRPYSESDFAAVCAIHDRARPYELTGSADPRAFRPMVEEAEEEEFFASKTLVAWLYVDPDHHRRGIGSMLLGEALKHCGSQAWVNTMDGNAAAISLYRKAGFELVKSFPSDCDGYPCTCVRLALTSSRMRDPAARREI